MSYFMINNETEDCCIENVTSIRFKSEDAAREHLRNLERQDPDKFRDSFVSEYHQQSDGTSQWRQDCKIRMKSSRYTLTPPEGCPFKVGDIVTFTNEYGVSFHHLRIYGFVLPDRVDEFYGRTVYTEKSSYWFPSFPHELKHEHTVER